MRVVKPQPLSLVYRPMEIGDRFFLSVGAMALFHLERPGVLFHEAKLWQLAAEELGVDAVVDEGWAKPQAEVLVEGRAYPPSAPQHACEVRLRLGSIDKRLRVIGDRRWSYAGVATDPEPFTEMPMTWARAFGGDGFAANPVGRGAGSTAGPHMLPNVTRPGEVLRSPSDRLVPSGFGAIPVEWPTRSRYAGTYDARWMRERSPSPPVDRDLRLFQTASPDQWLAEPLAGDEAVVIDNMHPERPRFEGRLPGVRMRCLVSSDGEARETREAPMRLETLRLFPHRELGIAIFRALVETTEDDADDIAVLFVAAEPMGEARPRTAYETALRRRLDVNGGALAWLDESDLLPAASMCDEAKAPWNEAPPQGILEKRMRARATAELAAAREALRAEGIDPDEHGVPAVLPEPRPREDDLHEQIAKAKTQAEEAKKQAEDEARRACEEAGIEYDAMMEKARREAARPPAFSAATILEELYDQAELAKNAGMDLAAVALLKEPDKLRARLEQQEALIRDAYRRTAHEGARPEIGADEAARLREAIREAVARGDSLAGQDLTGADLRGLSLAGADLRGAFLAAADIDDCDLSQAKLDGAVLAHTRGVRVRLSGANLDGTNLGKAGLAEATLDEVTGRETILTGADLSGASLDRAAFAGAELDDLRLDGAHSERLELREAVRARGVSARGARIRMMAEQTMLTDLAASGADLSESSLTRVGLVDPVLERAKLTRAKLDRCAFAGGIAMTECDLSESIVTSTSLGRAQLAGSSLREATLDGSDLSRADLRDTSLYRAKARGALLVRANLEGARATSLDAREAILDRARLGRADLTGAHLFAASLVRVDVDDKTRLDGAVTDRAEMSPRKKGGGR